jgi:hypothetical protein
MKQIFINLAKAFLIFFGLIAIFCWALFAIVVSFGGFTSPAAYLITIGPILLAIFIGIYQKVKTLK